MVKNDVFLVDYHNVTIMIYYYCIHVKHCSDEEGPMQGERGEWEGEKEIK